MRYPIQTAAYRCQASGQFLPGNAVYNFVRVIKPTDMLSLIWLKIHPLLGHCLYAPVAVESAPRMGGVV
jgi:hypothetical protein